MVVLYNLLVLNAGNEGMIPVITSNNHPIPPVPSIPYVKRTSKVMYIIMGPSAIWAGPCRVLVTHVGSLWGCEQGWAMWVKQCHVYRPWLAMVYTTHKSGDDWGDCLLLFYPHYRFSNVAVEDGPCIADDLWWLRKYDFPWLRKITKEYWDVLGI